MEIVIAFTLGMVAASLHWISTIVYCKLEKKSERAKRTEKPKIEKARS